MGRGRLTNFVADIRLIEFIFLKEYVRSSSDCFADWIERENEFGKRDGSWCGDR